MANLVELDLAGNQISDDGVTALAKAITPASKGGSGAMAWLNTLIIGQNAFSDTAKEQLKATCKARNIKVKKDFFDIL
jgi:hypothetical protein